MSLFYINCNDCNHHEWVSSPNDEKGICRCGRPEVSNHSTQPSTQTEARATECRPPLGPWAVTEMHMYMYKRYCQGATSAQVADELIEAMLPLRAEPQDRTVNGLTLPVWNP